VQKLTGERLDFRRKGRRKEQALSARRQQREDTVQFFSKTEVEQPVGFIEHQRGNLGQMQRVVIDQVEQASGRGNDDIGTAAQGHHLRIDRHAAKEGDDFRLDAQMLRQAVDRCPDLRSELACRHEDQRVDLQCTAWRLLRLG